MSLFRGHLGLSNRIFPSRIDCFLVEIWPKEWLKYRNCPIPFLSSTSRNNPSNNSFLIALKNSQIFLFHSIIPLSF
jgi:hypothetical protein